MDTFNEEIDETVQMIWSTMFDLPLIRQAEADDITEAPMVTGFVILEGSFDGAVLLRCPEQLAEKLTGLMFATADTPGPADIRDAIGEVANMLAGNLKSVLPHPSHIGLPVVAFGQDYQLEVLGTRTVGSVTYACLDEQLTVTLVQQAESSRENA